MSKLVQQLSLVITSVLALMYGVGYLVTSLFYGSWGISGHALDFLRAHYIHIGFLCLTPPVAFGGVHFASKWILAAKLKLRDPSSDANNNATDRDLTWGKPGKYSVLAVIVGFYFVGLLAERSRILHAPWVYWPMVTFPSFGIFGLVVSNAAHEFVMRKLSPAQLTDTNKRFLRQARDFFKWISCAIAWIAVAVMLLVGLRETLVDLICYQWVPLSIYVLLAVLLCVIVNHNINNVVYVRQQHARPVLAFAACCLSLPLCYFMVVSFAFGLFPYIPVSRGGANFLEARPVSMVTETSDAWQPIGNVRQGTASRMFIIQETGDLLYLAVERENSTSADWRHRGKRPQIVVVNRDAIRAISTNDND